MIDLASIRAKAGLPSAPASAQTGGSTLAAGLRGNFGLPANPTPAPAQGGDNGFSRLAGIFPRPGGNPAPRPVRDNPTVPGGNPAPRPGGNPAPRPVRDNPTVPGANPPADVLRLDMIDPYAGQPFVDNIRGIGSDAMNSSNQQFQRAVRDLQRQANASGITLDQLMTDMGLTVDQIQNINTDLGTAFDSSDIRDTILGTDVGTAFDTTGAQTAITGAGAGLGAFDTTGAQSTMAGINTDFGSAFDTSGSRGQLMGMDIPGMQSRYESQYVDQMVDPTIARMQEDEARRLAQLEASGAAIGGGSNTRMAVEMARTTDEGLRSRAQAEATMRNDALRQAQELGLQEAGLRGQFADTAGRLGLSQTEQEAATRQAQSQTQAQLAGDAARLGLSEEDQAQRAAQLQSEFANMGAQLGLTQADQTRTNAVTQAQLAADAARIGMAESELAASIAQRQAQLGLSQAEARQSVLNDIAGVEGAKFGMAASAADLRTGQAANTLEAARTGIAAEGIGLEQAELERQINTEINQIPLTMESWYRNMIGSPLATPLPSGGTQTQSGGGPGVGTQLLGAGTSLLGAFLMSDENVKTDIEPLGGALDIIRRQRPSSYTYTDAAYDRVPIEGRRSAGLMAQDLEDIPGAVVQNEHGFKMVDPYPVIATIAAAVQELDRKMEGLAHGG